MPPWNEDKVWDRALAWPRCEYMPATIRVCRVQQASHDYIKVKEHLASSYHAGSNHRSAHTHTHSPMQIACQHGQSGLYATDAPGLCGRFGQRVGLELMVPHGFFFCLPHCHVLLHLHLQHHSQMIKASGRQSKHLADNQSIW